MNSHINLIDRYNLVYHRCLGTITNETIQTIYRIWNEIKSYPIIFKCICGNLEPNPNDFLNLCIAINEGMPPYQKDDIWLAITWMIDNRLEKTTRFYFDLYYSVDSDGNRYLQINNSPSLIRRVEFFNNNYSFDPNLGMMISVYIDIIQSHQDWCSIRWPEEILLLCEEYILRDDQYALKRELGINSTRLLKLFLACLDWCVCLQFNNLVDLIKFMTTQLKQLVRSTDRKQWNNHPLIILLLLAGI